MTAPDNAAFGRLVEALGPWLCDLVVVGGWTHQLHRANPLAGKLSYSPLRTDDSE